MLQDFFWDFDLYQTARTTYQRARAPSQIKRWEQQGRNGPPPHAIKQGVLREYAQRFGMRILVESGTYHGDMVAALTSSFEQIYSIELSKELHAKARRRFRNHANINLIQGDSGSVLKELVAKLPGPALFWLDGHYSAGPTAHGVLSTPIYEELRYVLNASERRHVIIIDDARCFGVEKDYPAIDQLTSFINSQREDVEVLVKDDSIRISPSAAR